MKTPTHSSIRVSLEMGMIAFFILAALSLMVVYLADPSIYAQSLSLTSSPADRYPVPVTLLLVGILAVIALLILGVVRHWRWVFWLMLVAFAGSALQIPVTLLQIAGVLPSPDPLWYSLFRMGVAVVEITIAVWMIHIYRHKGVWALGKKRHERYGSMTGMDGLAIGKKPPIVTRVTSVIAFASTIIALVAGLSLLWPGTIFDMLWKLNPAAQTEFVRGGRLVGLLLLCLGIMTSVAGVGLVKGKTWAWWLTLLLLVAVGAVNLRRLLAGDPGEVFGTPFTLGLLWLHVQPKVRKFFLSS